MNITLDLDAETRSVPVGQCEDIPPGFDAGRVVGSGGTAVVHDAVCLRSGRRVALKVGHEGLSPALRTALWREAALGLMLDQPGLPRTLAHGVHGSRPWIAHRFIDGAPLRRVAASASLTARRRLQVVARVARLLHHLHGYGWIHRDVKASNVMLSRQGIALIDLGIASRVDGLDDLDAMLCTPHCSPPEQLERRRLGVTADVFQLGVLLYEVLCFELPWAEAEPLATALAICSAPPRAFAEVVRPDIDIDPDLCASLSRLLDACLARAPKDRPATALAVAEALERLAS